MKTIWTIDSGNSNPHIGRFESGIFLGVFPLKDPETFAKKFEEGHALFIESKVGPKSFKNMFKPYGPFISSEEILSKKRLYEMYFHYSPSLGADRFVLAQYIFDKILSESSSVLIIDAGTFMTLDVVTHSGFFPGPIVPGIQNLLLCFERGNNLKPFVQELSTSFKKGVIQKKLEPLNTPQAIQSGIISCLLGPIREILKRYPIQKIILTGGDSKILQSILELHLEHDFESHTHLIHYALEHMAKLILNTESSK